VKHYVRLCSLHGVAPHLGQPPPPSEKRSAGSVLGVRVGVGFTLISPGCRSGPQPGQRKSGCRQEQGDKSDNLNENQFRHAVTSWHKCYWHSSLLRGDRRLSDRCTVRNLSINVAATTRLSSE